MRILVIDNYDSFTYNIVQALGALSCELEVRRNDCVRPEEIEELAPDRILISPGPCTPREAGVSVEAVKRCAGKIPLLGVCLGHQAIAHAFGATVDRADRLMHGKTSMIRHDGRGLFRGLTNPFEATRYHSLIVREKTLPPEFEVTARSEDQGEVMGLRHKELPLAGVQFHPESFLTLEGPKLLKNFIEDGWLQELPAECGRPTASPDE